VVKSIKGTQVTNANSKLGVRAVNICEKNIEQKVRMIATP